MKELTSLECIADIADMQYHKTGDKWWLALGLEVSKKINRRNHVLAQKATE